MEDICSLCVIYKHTTRVIAQTDLVYSIVPHAPLVEGHVLITPYRHTLFEGLQDKELLQLRDMTCMLKEKLVSLYPATPPMLVSMMDTRHASNPKHFHYHLIPSAVNIRRLLSSYDSAIPENKILLEAELELMAKRLR